MALLISTSIGQAAPMDLNHLRVNTGWDIANWLANVTSPNELQVDMGDFESNTAYAKYSSFPIDRSLHEYKLYVCGYTGTAEDSTTKDNNNDGSSINCVIADSVAWWYGACGWSNPNGVYGDYME